MRIINTGGTFNKVYDPVLGKLVVPKSDEAVEAVVAAMRLEVAVEGIIYKDSLEMDDADRELLAQRIEASKEPSIVVVHGTDTMTTSAAYVARRCKKSCIVFTGAMVPYSIDKAEASANLALAIAKVKYAWEPGVFIAMHGIVAPYHSVYKDRKKGVFCLK